MADIDNRYIIDYFELKAKLEDEKIEGGLLKNLVIEYSKQERKLAELVKQKNYILGMAAHDIRNPLASIKGFADLLKDNSVGELNTTQKEFISIISNAASDLLVLLNDLLDFASVSQGSIELDLKENSLSELLLERIRLIGPLAEKKDIKIVFTGIFDERTIFFDRKKIVQVIDNLLSNAVKYSFIGTKVSVEIYHKINEESVCLDIYDSGPGIPEGEEKKLFGEFKKLNVSPTGGETSTGLGLAISKKIVEAHKGKIYGKNSDKTSGAVFGFCLPYEVN
ncbi:MAG: HAMP domain-containing histidine kinase [Desulfobacteraceae bacterium]|nr:HAMP domain-containing histidine kinase [Desulfobacteraceae bacterium]